jgi:hypothetical protein
MRLLSSIITAAVAVGILAACSGNAGSPRNTLPSASAQSSALTQAPAGRPTAPEFETWHSMLMSVPKPRGCVVATYPEIQWRKVQCVQPPNDPVLPAQGVRPTTVGNGDDWIAAVTGHVSYAQGSFHHVTGVTSENENGHRNDYSVQLNTQPFTTATCANLGSPDPSSCRGWEQFIYGTTGTSADVYIEYWLLNFGPGGTKCPLHWYTSGTTEISCFINSSGTTAPAEAITNLGNLLLSGTAALGSSSTDSAEFTVFGSSVYGVDGLDVFSDLDLEWQKTEFNIFGRCCAKQAVFNTGSQAVVRMEVDSGVTVSPACDSGGFTGETNNLYLTGESTSWPKVQYPSIVFTESNAAGRTPKSCVVEPAQ